MHIPNGFLTDPVCTVTAISSAAALGVGVARMRQGGDSRSAALMAATGAGIFAAQMVNFPIDLGTSGHLVGAALAGILLGPWRGMLTMAIVLAVQCFVFGDGGVSTLGANILNMAVAGTLVAAVVYAWIARQVTGTKGRVAGAGAAALASVLASAALCAVELAASIHGGWADMLWAMISVHAVIGLAEAAISVAILAALAAGASDRAVSPGRVMAGGLAVALVVAGLLAPLASTAPDGLESVAEQLQFASLAFESPAIAPDYEAPGVGWPALAVALAGIAGTVAVFVSSYTLGRTARVRAGKQ